jgi:hypothetical protein
MNQRRLISLFEAVHSGVIVNVHPMLVARIILAQTIVVLEDDKTIEGGSDCIFDILLSEFPL